MDHRNLLEIENLVCRYGKIQVLSGVSFSLPPGSVLGLIGENGAGKSTLVKAILGLLNPASGRIVRRGKVAAIHQEFNLARDLSVTENIFLGQEKKNRWGLLDRPLMRRLARAEFSRLGCTIDPEAKISDLTISQRQMTEIAKATAANAAVLIMDEPSTLLNGEETENLFSIIREYRKNGNSVIYISHKLEEVREICDHIAVLRDGVLVDFLPARAATAAELAEKMVGRELHAFFPDKLPVPAGEALFRAEHLTSGNRVIDLSFEIHSGEILGLSGLAGAGRSELADTIFGIRKKDGGRIFLHGREVRIASPGEAIKHRIGYLTEDRQGTGLLTDFDLAENITLSSLAKYCRFGWLRHRETRKKAQEYVKKFNIRCGSVKTLLKNLSGGNQQKVALAKGVDVSPELFIFDEPTRGVDVAARREIYDFIHQLAARGTACLMISSDLEELLGMCRKVMVMRNGRLAGFAEEPELSEKNLIHLATGVNP